MNENNKIVLPIDNVPRAKWEEQFQTAITKDDDLPEESFLEGFANEFDESEWIW